MNPKTKKIILWSVIGLGVAAVAYYLYTQSQGQSSSLSNEAAAVLPGNGGGSSSDPGSITGSGIPGIAPISGPPGVTVTPSGSGGGASPATIPGGHPGPSTGGGIISTIGQGLASVPGAVLLQGGPGGVAVGGLNAVGPTAYGQGAPIGTTTVLNDIAGYGIARNPTAAPVSIIRPSGPSRT